MNSSLRNIAVTGLICLAILAFAYAPLASAQLETPAGISVHDCTIEEAVDRTNEAEVVLQWSNPHHQCVLVSPGTTITWNGNFAFHPLAGGVTPDTDNSSPISSADDQGGSVVLNNEGDYPYFCEVHINTMTGVIYVRAPLPAEFDKSDPADGASNQATDLQLSWQSSTGATAFEYCWDTTDNDACDTSWTSAGANTSANPAGLTNNTNYYWQVRAINDNGAAEANSGSWWRFGTVPAPPTAFGKSNPADGATGRSTAAILSWSASTGAASYEYCIDNSNNDACNDSWKSAGANTSAEPSGLSVHTGY
jgi:plastocyanin